jgi:hypothetical protein
LQSDAAEFEPVVDLTFFEEFGLANGAFEAIRSAATVLKRPLLEPEMQTGVHVRRAFKTGGMYFERRRVCRVASRRNADQSSELLAKRGASELPHVRTAAP